MKKTKKKKTTKKDEVKALKETLQRLQAEFENYKKRTDKENSDFRIYAEKDFIKTLLPMLDNFELALQNKKSHDEFVKGIELIYAQLYQLMEEKGLKAIESEGKKFNPYMHEALMSEESNKEANIILEVLQKGYTFKDKVIRHSKVKVSKKKPGGK